MVRASMYSRNAMGRSKAYTGGKTLRFVSEGGEL